MMPHSSQQEIDSDVKSQKLKTIEKTIRSQVECEERAFHIVNKLIESHVDGDYLVECGKLINATHYTDIIEERTISRLCGYPVCPNSLGEIPKNKYHISTRTNKVYEISERKSFCSNQCFRASRHFSAQIPESPLWMRDKETLPEISLLQHDKIKGIVGDEVIGSNPRKLLKDDLESLEQLDKKTSTSKRRSGVTDAERNGRQTKKEPANNRKDEQESMKPEDIFEETKSVDRGQLLTPHNDGPMTREISDGESSVSVDFPPAGAEITETRRGKSVKDEPDLPALVQKFEHLEADENVSQEDSNSPKLSDLSFADSSHEILVPNRPPQAPSSNNSSQTQDKTLAKMDLLKTLLSKRKNVLSKMADVQTLEQLCPDDSSALAKGCESVKEDTEDLLASGGSDGNSKSEVKPSILSSAGHSVTASPSPQTQQQSRGIPTHSSPCSPLSRVCEILKTWVTRESGLYLSSHSDSEGIQRFSDPEVQQRYGALCHRLAAQELEMEAALDTSLVGEKNARASKPVPDYKALKEQTEAFKLNVMEFITGKKQVLNQEDNQTEEDSTICLPTVDSHNQHQIRVKIVLDRLDKSLPDVLTPLQLSVQDVSSPVREFIYTCRLEKDNIVLKPGEWTLAALFILKMLAIKYPRIQSSFSSQAALRHFSAVLTRLGQSLAQLDTLTQDIFSVAHLDNR